MPKSLTKDEASATETYAKFIAEPFEAGYGHTVGNSLRRVLLSSLEGAAITSIRITGAPHEFATLTGVVEDVTDIVQNLKKIKFKAVDRAPRTVTINVNKEGQITAGDIQTIQGIEVLNTNQAICTLDKKQKFEAEPKNRLPYIALNTTILELDFDGRASGTDPPSSSEKEPRLPTASL